VGSNPTLGAMIRFWKRKPESVIPEMSFTDMVDTLRLIRLPPGFSATIDRYVSENRNHCIWFDTSDGDPDWNNLPIGFRIYISYQTKNSLKPEEDFILAGTNTVSNCRVDIEFLVHLVYKVLQDMYNHEIDEWLTYDGEYYNPPVHEPKRGDLVNV
jgi:hypothetical protein